MYISSKYLPRVSSILGLLQASPLFGSPTWQYTICFPFFFFNFPELTIPKGFILFIELEVDVCLVMFEKVGLPMDLVLLILNVVAGFCHASWASSVSSIPLILVSIPGELRLWVWQSAPVFAAQQHNCSFSGWFPICAHQTWCLISPPKKLSETRI